MATETFNSRIGIADPFTDAVAVTPNDSTDIARISRGLYIGGSGDVAVITKDGTTTTLVNALAGTYLPIRVSRVLATGTTATNIVAMY